MGRRVLRAFLYQRELTPIVITIVLFLYFAFRAGSNFTGSLSLSSAVGYAGPIGAIAIGEVFLLVLAEIDLSAGQVFLFCPWMMYWMHNDGLPLVLAIVIALFAVCLVGAFNGLITVRLNVPSFVTTLATNFILYGIVLVASDNLQGSPIPLSGENELHRPAHGGLEVVGDPVGARAHDSAQRGAHAHALRRSDHRHGRQSRRRGRGGRAHPAREGVVLRALLLRRGPRGNRRLDQVRDA